LTLLFACAEEALPVTVDLWLCPFASSKREHVKANEFLVSIYPRPSWHLTTSLSSDAHYGCFATGIQQDRDLPQYNSWRHYQIEFEHHTGRYIIREENFQSITSNHEYLQ
jgi:hypothetical protein